MRAGRGEAWQGVAGYDVVRILVGALLITAALLKGYQLATEPVRGNGLFASRGFLIAVVEIELLLGLTLCSGLAPWHTWLTGLLCFGCFFAVSLYKAVSGELSCGCFGKWAVNPWYTATLDLAVVASLLWWRPGAALGMGVRRASGLAVLFGVWIPVGALIAVWTWSPRVGRVNELGEESSRGLVVVQPEPWTGKRLPLLLYIEHGAPLERGSWLILLYHHDGPACQEVLRRVETMRVAAGAGDAWVALVEVPPYGELPAGLPGKDVALRTRLRNCQEWFVATPVLFVVREGTVASVGTRQRLGIDIRP
mgnify:CR=1 FL=1